MKRLAGLLLVTVLLTPGCRGFRRRGFSAVRVTVGPAWVGVPPLARTGLRMLAADLAVSAGARVYESDSPDLAPDILLLSLEGSARTDGGLTLQAHFRMPGRPDLDFTPLSTDPCSQMKEILAAAGLRPADPGAFLPQDPSRLLPLADAYARAFHGTVAEALAAAQAASGLQPLEPRCAPAALAQAAGILSALDDGPGPSDLKARADCSRAFDEALARSKGYPRAAALAARFLTDTGDQRRAISILLDAIRRFPKAAGLRQMLSYAARTAGLLDGAQLALQDAGSAIGEQPGEEALITRNAYLYAGDWGRFESSLGEGSVERPDPMRDFYRGYIRLLRGRAEEALPCFRKATLPTDRSAAFHALALVYQNALEGHTPEARLTLRNLILTRKVQPIPDGEFTFKLAEASAYLGGREEAMDLAQLAFSQGFGCTAWYERTPLLAPLHDLPRWRALLDHLRARQRLMESLFPARDFAV